MWNKNKPSWEKSPADKMKDQPIYDYDTGEDPCYITWEYAINNRMNFRSVFKFESLPVNKSATIDPIYTQKEAIAWAYEQKMKVKRVEKVLYNGQVRVAVVFKSENDALMFKLRWS